MRVVMDTNVLVAGLLLPFGLPREIVRILGTGIVQACFDVRILSEHAPAFAGLRLTSRQATLEPH